MKKLGIYNPHINTMGGGEKVTLALADCLSKDYNVSLIVRDKIVKSKFEDYFDVDLGNVKVVVLPKGGLITRHLTSPSSHLPGRLREIIASASDYGQLNKLGLDIFINSYYQSNCKSVVKRGIYMCMFPQRLKGTIKKKGSIAGTYHFAMSLLERAFGLGRAAAINSYDVILANSEYTQGWIRKLWDKDATILYPICDNMGPPKDKEKIILNVGRLFASTKDNHHKCQDVLLAEFKKAKRLQDRGWQLHIAGGTAGDPDSLKYVIKLIEDASGYPVFFHLNISHAELKELYGRSSIYWHATGYGKDPDKRPETQEHFGITTVEAMSAGVVPVVIDSAGQRESVVHGESGYLWNDLPEMVKYTTQLADNNKEYTRLSYGAIKASRKFSRKSFRDRINSIINGNETKK